MVFVARPYPREFREGAVALARQGERPIPEIAKELGSLNERFGRRRQGSLALGDGE
jgi:transposase-like protein